MRKSYEKQILNDNIKKFNLIIKADLKMFFSAKTLTQANQNAELQVNIVNGAKKRIEDFKYHFEKDKYWRLQYSYLSINYWYFTKTIANKSNILGLINALAVFIKQEQAKSKMVENTLDKCRKNDNLCWIVKYSIQIHSSIAT